MNPTLKRALLIAAIVLVALTFFFLIWLIFFKPGAIVNINNGGGNVNGLPPIGNQNINGVSPVSNINALPYVNGDGGSLQPTEVANGGPTYTNTVVPTSSTDLTMSGANNLRFYDRTTGKFFELSADGLQKNLLSDATYRDIETINWSPDGDKAILTFPDDSKVLYDFATDKQTTLPSELNEFSFSPDSDQVVSKYLNAGNTEDQWLMVSNPDGSQSSAAEHLGVNANKVVTAWSPNNQIIAVYEKGYSSDLSELIFLGASGENFESATVDGRGFVPNWSPDGRKLLYSTYSENTNNNPHLYLMNGSPNTIGTNLLDLGLDTTADKCTFSASGLAIYCAVPYYLNEGSGPQPELSADVPDNIYRVDLISGSAELIARPIDSNLWQRFRAVNLQVTSDERYLYFIDENTGTVESIQLKNMTRPLIVGLVLAGLAFGAATMAADTGAAITFNPEVPLPNFVGGPISGTTMAEYIRAVFVFFIWSVGLLAVTMIVYGGIKWVAAAGNAARINDARDIINNAIIGLIIALTSVVLLNLIDPRLTSFQGLTLKTVDPNIFDLQSKVAAAVEQNLGPWVTCQSTSGVLGEPSSVCYGSRTNPTCRPDLNLFISGAAKKYNIDSFLVKAIIQKESLKTSKGYPLSTPTTVMDKNNPTRHATSAYGIGQYVVGTLIPLLKQVNGSLPAACPENNNVDNSTNLLVASCRDWLDQHLDVQVKMTALYLSQISKSNCVNGNMHYTAFGYFLGPGNATRYCQGDDIKLKGYSDAELEVKFNEGVSYVSGVQGNYNKFCSLSKNYVNPIITEPM